MKSLLRKTLKAAFALFTLTLLIFVTVRLLLRPPKSPDALLQEADRKAWRSAWEEAEPLYQKAEQALSQRHELSKALYARVSQMPAHMGTDNLADRIWTLTQDLALPEAQDPATKLRILMVRGLFETNYDASGCEKHLGKCEDFGRIAT